MPRNWAQQVPPYIEILNMRLGTTLTPPRFHYGVRICPEPDYWGGLSGCTYQEGISGGNSFHPNKGDGSQKVLSDATVVLGRCCSWPYSKGLPLNRTPASRDPGYSSTHVYPSPL